jgi:hypothetical protein
MNLGIPVIRCNLIVLFLPAFFLSASAVHAASTDSSILPRKPHRLTQQQFLDWYGTDDSSRALIDYYYPKHRKNAILALYSGGALIVTGSLAALVLAASAGNLLSLLALIALLACAYYFGALLLVSLTFLLMHSRRRLYKMLLAYRNGKPISHHSSRKKAFLRLLK